MSVVAKYEKDPDAILDYGLDWTEWLPDGVTIASSSWIPEDGITVLTDSKTDTGTVVRLSGGTDGEQYTVTNRVVLTDGQKDDRSLQFSIKQR